MIVVFGSVNLDLVVRVERFPEPGETIAGSSFALLPGGKGANQALAARRAGAEVAMAGAVGTDAFATTALVGLAAAGVDLTWVERTRSPTGVAMIHVDAHGQNSITVAAGANGEARAAAVPDIALGRDTTLVMQLEVPIAEVASLAVRAKRNGARVVLNAAPAGNLPSGLLESLDVLIVNEHEAAGFAAALGAPGAPEAFASAIERRHACATVVTLGARGALVATKGRLLFAAAPAVDVVDTTGAGDAFAGALAAALDRGATWPRALAIAIAAGALACESAGAQSALPTEAAIDRLADIVEREVDSRPIV